MGLFSTRVMGLGLGLLSSLSVAQVRGVLGTSSVTSPGVT